MRGISVAVIAAAIAIATAAPAVAQPPDVRVSSASDYLIVEPRSWCWPVSGSPPICEDGHFIPNPTSWLTVPVAEAVEFALPEEPKSIRVQVWKPLPKGADIRRAPHGEKVTETMLPVSQRATWRPKLPPGRYVVSVGAFWPTQHAAWVTGIDVQGPRTTPWVWIAAAAALAAAVYAATGTLRRRRVDPAT